LEKELQEGDQAARGMLDLGFVDGMEMQRKERMF